MERLKGKVAIITRVVSGMGATHARMFVAEGAKVVITDVNETAGKALEKELGADHALFIKHDVSRSADWKHVVATAEEKFGPITVLVNNTEVFKPQILDEASEEDYQKTIDVNQLSVFLGMLYVNESMRKAKVGAIVNISSVAGPLSSAGMLTYGVSKFAMRGMSKTAALALAQDNIRINFVHPGAIKNSIAEATYTADPSAISRLVVFLASDELYNATGEEFVVDGVIARLSSF